MLIFLTLPREKLAISCASKHRRGGQKSGSLLEMVISGIMIKSRGV